MLAVIEQAWAAVAATRRWLVPAAAGCLLAALAPAWAGSLTATPDATVATTPATTPAATPARSATAVPAGDWADMADTVFEHLRQRDGLPHAIATAVVEDRRGYLWAGTQEGLARWDGYRFRVYAANRADPGALPAGFVRALAVDARGRLWVGADGSGVARYDEASDRFVRFGAASVGKLAADAEGGVWAAGVGGLLHVRADDRIERAWPHDGGGADALPDTSITAVLQDRVGSVWVGSTSALVRRFPDGRPGLTIALPGASRDAPASVDALFEDARGRIWVGTALHGVFVVDPASGAVHALQAGATADPGLAHDSVTAFAANGIGQVWIGTVNRGLVVADLDTLRTRRIAVDRGVPTGLQSIWIWDLHRDRSGQMWVAATDGLSRTGPQQDAILTLFSSNDPSWADSSVLAIDANRDGSVRLGQFGGIEVLDAASGRTSAIRLAGGGGRDAAALGYVRTIAHSADGGHFLGGRDGLFRLAPGAHALVPVDLPQRGAVRSVTALLVRGRTLWLGGKGDGVWTLDLAAPAPVPRQPVPPGELTDLEVGALLAGPGDSIWIGAKNGLNLLTPGRAVERILARPGDASSLPAAAVNALLTDRLGRLWVGTNAGMAVMLGRDGSGRPVFHRIGKAEGLKSLNVDGLLLDDDGRVWASTDDGLVVVDPASLRVRALRAAEGVAISSYWANSAARSPRRELFFGGLGGLTVVRPQRLKPLAYAAPVVATEVLVGGQPVTPGQLGDPALLTVPADAGSFAVEFAQLDFSTPSRTRYAYWLEGFDKGWREVDATHRMASYTNLAPGRYTLRVKASDRDGQWAQRPLALDVDILPAWHQTWWFDLLKGLAALALVGLVVAVRMRYAQRRSLELERLVEQRTRELTALQHQLEELAYSDSLTGLPNRRMFGDHCRRMIGAAQRHASGFALLLIDLDHFKQVNDTLGHDAGDALLVEAARRLRKVARQADVVARLGGDEFAILLSDVASVDGVENACGRVLDAFEEPALFNELRMAINLSIGIALYPGDGRSQDELFKSADLALYQAKRAGRHTWRFALGVALTSV